ncbi:MAG TPA: PAS domain-containing protein, partial [Stellaceae bacterium]|nr:PAS domain-containing protein [Stellaceae bacterium]
MSSVPTGETGTGQPGETQGLLAVGGHALARAFDLAHAMIREIDGRIRFWSSSLERLYGWKREDAIGQISHDLLSTEFPKP